MTNENKMLELPSRTKTNTMPTAPEKLIRREEIRRRLLQNISGNLTNIRTRSIKTT